jgi:hypothetical protein
VQPSSTPTSTFTVVPFVIIDASGKILVVMKCENILGVCFERLENDSLSPEMFQRLLKTGTWATLFRTCDNTYFVIVAGSAPKVPIEQIAIQKKDEEAVRMAIEIGLTSWPEWGSALRSYFKPRHTVPVGFPSSTIEV